MIMERNHTQEKRSRNQIQVSTILVSEADINQLVFESSYYTRPFCHEELKLTVLIEVVKLIINTIIVTVDRMIQLS